MPNTNNKQKRSADNDVAGRRASDGSLLIQSTIINQNSGDAMAETIERVAVVETIAHRNEASLERLYEENSAMRLSTHNLFSEVRESLVLLKASTENMARAQEAIVSRVDTIVGRVGALEMGLERHKHHVEKHHEILIGKIDDVDSGWRGEKAKLVAYGSAGAFIISGLWSVFGGGVKAFLGQ